MILPNPESALNEEAGKLLLEQYEDYAKRARLYTSIQAKSGKSQYLLLVEQRQKENQSDEQEASKTLPNQKRPLEEQDIKKKTVKKRLLRRL